MIRLRSRGLAAGILIAAVFHSWIGVGASVHAATPDPLHNPSILSERAATRIMLAIAYAEKRLVAVGERGIVQLSDDNGGTWRQAKVPVSVTLTGVHFPSATKGWAVGHSGVVLHSEDAGQTWVKQLDGSEAARIIAEDAMKRAKTAEGASAQAIVADAERFVADGPDKPFLDVYFADERNGMVVGAYGLAFTTNDGGRHWVSWIHNIPNPNGKHLYRIYSHESALWIIGEQGALFRSQSQGKAFVVEDSPYPGSLFGMTSGAKRNLVVFGLRGNAFHSDDDGQKWSKINIGTTASFTAGTRLEDGSLILVDQAGRILRSIDQGRTFTSLPMTQQFPITGVIQGNDGSLVLTSVRGIIRIPALKLMDLQ